MSNDTARPDAPHRCFVCGPDLPSVGENPPWGATGNDPTFAVCPCCGAEFGYQDATLNAARTRRRQWVEDRYAWVDEGRKPEGWDAARQLSNLPTRVR